MEEYPMESFSTYLLVWLGLLNLTGLTIAVTIIHMGKLSILAAILIASIKATLVLREFMHLKHEKAMFKYMFFVAVATLTIFIGLTFFDIAFR
jgi:cytochrome c oxidase subunit 4